MASGWGVLDPNQKNIQATKLQSVHVYTMTQRQCEIFYDNDGSVTDSMMCAKSYSGKKHMSSNCTVHHRGRIGVHLKRSNIGSLLVSIAPLGVLSWIPNSRINYYVFKMAKFKFKVEILHPSLWFIACLLSKKSTFQSKQFPTGCD